MAKPPSREVKPAIAGIDGLLKQFRVRYSEALSAVEGMHEKACDAGIGWPQWCWLPMAAFHTLAISYGGNPATEVGRSAALALWELGRGVYVPDTAVAEVAYKSLRHAATAGAVDWHRVPLPPLESWAGRLPEWCCYLALPPELADLDVPVDVFRPRGVYVNLESDANTGRSELRLLLDTDGTWDGFVPIPVYLDRPTLGAAIADMSAVSDAAAAGAYGVDLRTADGPSTVVSMRGLVVWMVLPFVLALIDPDARHADFERPGDAPVSAQPGHNGRLRPAKSTRTWRITYRTPGRHLRSI
ncbi:hypothetical protein [Nocardia sp. NRRL S-836]|uniref:hypothetical protein n=1 Tax=Nocardia sp. NRRL S-836 TaxID=1519492 RepID=UPI0006ADF8E9|nr:hypothetical protein [Nocardia sp. NRRL S-836]KOV84614.1 hypothetical protein ADL03_15050 [Nocardia sp. NRRL S-836]